MKSITSFKNDFRFLSNFYPVEIVYDNISYKSTECAYQAQKTFSIKEKILIASFDSYKSKKYSRKLKLRKDWDNVKLDIMKDLLNIKFNKEPFKTLLINTGSSEIIEGNYWHDNYWGSCTCEKCNNNGLNHLGKLLMEIREKLNENKK